MAPDCYKRDQTVLCTLFWPWCKFLYWHPAIFSFLQRFKLLEKYWCFSRQRDDGTLYYVSLKQELLILTSNPSAACCKTPSILHQCYNWNHLMCFSLTLLTSQSPNCFISLISLSLPTGVTWIKSERILSIQLFMLFIKMPTWKKRSSVLGDISLEKIPKLPEFRPWQYTTSSHFQLNKDSGSSWMEGCWFLHKLSWELILR